MRTRRNTQDYYALPFNPQLCERARELRRAGTYTERMLWNHLKNKQFLGLDFDRQKIIGNYIVDFYSSNIGLVIEIDGSSHDDKQEYDAERDAYLGSFNLKVLHLSDSDVKIRLPLALHQIELFIQDISTTSG